MQHHDIWLVDPSKLFREGLKMLLIDSPFEVTREVPQMSLIDDISGPAANDPAVILIALHTVLEAGSDTESQLTRICRLIPGAAVVVLSDALSINQLVAAMSAGARAYLLRDIAPEALKQSLLLALTGETVLPTGLARMLVAGLKPEAVEEPESDSRGEPSARERLILQCVANGYPNKVIATRLNIAEATVKAHMKTVFRKIRVRNRTEAAVWALSNGYHAEALSQTFRQAYPVKRNDREGLFAGGGN